jgi:small subunit ribosomal protein S9
MADLQSLGTLRNALSEARPGEPQPAAEPAKPKLDAKGRAYATGKRKNAIARVWIKPGTGKITVNGRDSPIYFARPVLRMMINQPFGVVNQQGTYLLRAGLAAAAEAGWVSHARQPRGRAQEIRSRQGAT